MTETSDILIRRASAANLLSVGEIWFEAVSGSESEPPPHITVPSLYEYELESKELYVLELNGRVVAFAGLIERGPIAFLADLFVQSAFQSRGFGQRLLRHVLPIDDRICCTVSSDDPRAVPLYTRFGMLPTWPHLQLKADLSTLRLEREPT